MYSRAVAPLYAQSSAQDADDDPSRLAEDGRRAWPDSFGAAAAGTAAAAARPISRGSTTPRPVSRAAATATPVPLSQTARSATPAAATALDIYTQPSAWYRGGAVASSAGGSSSARASRPSSGMRWQPKRPVDPATQAATTAMSLGLSAATGLALLHSAPASALGSQSARPASRQLHGRSDTIAAGGNSLLPQIAAPHSSEEEEKTSAPSDSKRASSRPGTSRRSLPSPHSSPDQALRALMLNQAVLGSGGYFSFTPQPRVAVPAEPYSGAFVQPPPPRPASSVDTRMRPNHAGTPCTRVVPPFKPAFAIAAPAASAASAQRGYANYAQMMRTHSRAASAATAPATPASEGFASRARTPLSQHHHQRQQQRQVPGSYRAVLVERDEFATSVPGSGLASRSSRASLLRDQAGSHAHAHASAAPPGPELFVEEDLVGAEVMRLAAAPPHELLEQIMAAQREDEAAALEQHFAGEGHLAQGRAERALLGNGNGNGNGASASGGGGAGTGTGAAGASLSPSHPPAPSSRGTPPLTPMSLAQTDEQLAQQAAHIQELEAQFANLHRESASEAQEARVDRRASMRSKSRRSTLAKPLPPVATPLAAAAAVASGEISQRARFIAQRRALDQAEAEDHERQRAQAQAGATEEEGPSGANQAHVRFVDEATGAQPARKRPVVVPALSPEQQRAMQQRWAALDAARKAAGSSGSSVPDSITTIQSLWRGRRARARVARRRARLRAMEEAERRASDEQALLDQIAAQQQQQQQQQQQTSSAARADIDASSPVQLEAAMQHPEAQQPQPHPPKAPLPRRNSRKVRRAGAAGGEGGLAGSSAPSSAGPSSSRATPTPSPALGRAAQLRLQLKQSLQAEAALIRDMLLENAAKARIHAQHSAAQRAHRSALAHRALLSSMGGGGGGASAGSVAQGMGGAPRVPGTAGARRRDLYSAASLSLDENGSEAGEDPTDELLYGQLSGLGVGSAAGAGATEALDSFGFGLAAIGSGGGNNDAHRPNVQGRGRGHYHSGSMSSVSDEGGFAEGGGPFGLRRASLIVDDPSPPFVPAAAAASTPRSKQVASGGGLVVGPGGVSAGLADQIARWVTGFTGGVLSARKAAPALSSSGGSGAGAGSVWRGHSGGDDLDDRDADDMRFVSGASDLAGEPPLPPLPRSASDLAYEALERRNDAMLAGALREAKQSAEDEERSRVATCAAEVARALEREDALILVQSLARGRRARRRTAKIRADRPPQPKRAPAPPTAKQAAAAAAEAQQAALLEAQRVAEEARMASVAAARAEERRKEEEEEQARARILAAETAAAEAEAAAQAQALRDAQAAAQRESERIAAALSSSSTGAFALDLTAATELADLAPGLFALNPQSPSSAQRDRLASGQCDRCTDGRASLWCAACAMKLCDDLTGAGCDGDVHLPADKFKHHRVAWPVLTPVDGEGEEGGGAAHKPHSFSFAEGLSGSAGAGAGAAAALHKHSLSHPLSAPAPLPLHPAPTASPPPRCSSASASASGTAAEAAAAASSSTKCDQCRKFQASVWCEGCGLKLCDDLTGDDCDGALHLRPGLKQHRRVRWDPIRSPGRSRPGTAATAAATGVTTATKSAGNTRPQSSSVSGLANVLEHAALSFTHKQPDQTQEQEPGAKQEQQKEPEAHPAAEADTLPRSALQCNSCCSARAFFSCAACGGLRLCDPCDEKLHPSGQDGAPHQHERQPYLPRPTHAASAPSSAPLPVAAPADPPVQAAAAAAGGSLPLCDYCESGTRSFYCEHCFMCLCVACESELHSTRNKAAHVRNALQPQSQSEPSASTQPEAEVEVAAPILCAWCDSAVPTLYCESCFMPLCTTCESEVHAARGKDSHQCRPIDQQPDSVASAPAPATELAAVAASKSAAAQSAALVTTQNPVTTEEDRRKGLSVLNGDQALTLAAAQLASEPSSPALTSTEPNTDFPEFPRGAVMELEGGSLQLSYPILVVRPHVSPSPALVRSGLLPFDPAADLVAFQPRTFSQRDVRNIITAQSTWRRREATRRVRRIRKGKK